MKLHQDKSGPCRVPHHAWHGHLAPFLSFGTANPWGALKNLCLQQSSDDLWCLPKHPGAKGAGHMLVATLVGQKDIARIENCFYRCALVPVSCFPLLSQCRSSAETFLKHSALHLATFFFIDSNFQPAMDSSVKLSRICCFLKKDKQKANAMELLLVFNRKPCDFACPYSSSWNRTDCSLLLR